MTSVFNPVEELRRNGLCDDTVSAEVERILSTMTRPQVEACVEAKRRVDTLQSPDVQEQPVEDGSLVLAMTRAMGWDRPSIKQIDAEVEGMSTAVAPAECACLCTGSGGGGGAAA